MSHDGTIFPHETGCHRENEDVVNAQFASAFDAWLVYKLDKPLNTS